MTVREPHEDGVADCEAEGRGDEEPLPVAQCVAVTRPLPLVVEVGQSLALTEGENEVLLVMVRVAHEDGVADCEVVRRGDAEPLLVAHGDAVMLALPLEDGVGRSLALAKGECSR